MKQPASELSSTELPPAVIVELREAKKDLARAHFANRRMERQYGTVMIQEAYNRF